MAQTRMTLIPTSKPAFSYERDVRSALITLEWKGPRNEWRDWMPYEGLDRGVVIGSYAPLVYPFQRTNPEWCDAKLKTCEEVGPGQWKVEIELPYLD